jgi:hypothetical protein
MSAGFTRFGQTPSSASKSPILSLFWPPSLSLLRAPLRSMTLRIQHICSDTVATGCSGTTVNDANTDEEAGEDLLDPETAFCS